MDQMGPSLRKWWKKNFGQRFSPKVWKSGLFSKARVTVRVRVRVSYSNCENGHFRWTRWYPRLGKWWKKNLWTTFWVQSVEKVDFFQTLGLPLGLGLGLGLAIQIVKMATFDGPDGVQGWESDEERIFGQRFGPKVLKKWTFSKARVSVRVKVRVRVSLSFSKSGHFQWTRWRPRLTEWWKKNFWTTFWAQGVEKVDFFQKLGLALALGLGLGLATQFVKMATFDGPDGVQGWESDEKRIFGQWFEPKVWKK